ncbi:hypothetical protein [Haloarchaeobius sp. HRN-SO-5]|uniref:hypothetical protein n=1 Tax=Haloarchaeobius sp. HRN-SO-5 TaxID=3446118 RepID=UPI003EBF22BD
MTDGLETASQLYHVTGIRNLDAILERGVQPQAGHRDALEDDLSDVAVANDIDLPIDRSECVFCYPTLAAATELVEPIGDECPSLSRRKAIVVIEGSRIGRQLYVGEFDYISDAIDLQYMEEPDAAVTAESYDDALHRYAATLTELESFEELDHLTGAFQRPEIVVEGGIEPDRIVEWRLLKQIRDKTRSSE